LENYYEEGHGPAASMKGARFLDSLSDYQLFKKELLLYSTNVRPTNEDFVFSICTLAKKTV
jgi:hypothetical protein